MPENLNYALYFNILFLSILGFGMLFGFVKGYKKASYNFVVMLIFYVIFFLTLDLVSKFLWDMHIPGLGNLLGHFISELSGVSSLQDVVTIYSEKFLGDHLGSTLSNEEFQLFISGFSLFIVKLIYTIIYFSVLQTIYKFFASIIRIIFFRTKREKERPKRRFLGAGVGLLSGAMNVYALLIIMGGLMSISESATNLIPDQDATMMPLDELVTAYNQNMIVSALENDDVTNIPLNHKIFDFSYSFKYHDKNISIRKELRFAEGIYNIYVQSDFKTTKNYSDISGQEVRETFTILSESDLFPAVLPLGIELASDYLDVEMTMTIDELYEIDWDKEAMQLGEIAAVTLDLLNAAGIVGDSSANYETVIFEGDDLRSLFDSLSESNLATLAAFVAIEPVLEGASADIKAIITLPEGIVFEDEFKAIGQFAGAVADTGITIGDFKSGDPTLILTTLSEVDFTVIYNSKIISNALINVISGKTNYNTFDVFNVPEDTVWYDLYDDNGNLIQNGELKNILFAVNEIVQVSDNINFTELNLNVIADFSNETINIIFESKVMVATVSKLVTEMDLGNTPLVISDSVFDENNYIIKEELKALAKSARMVFTTLTCDEGTTCGDTGFDLSKAFDLTEEEIEILIASEIVSATIGDLIIEKGGDVLTIPNSSLITIYVKQVEKNIISKEEVTNMFKALSVLGITDIDNMNFDASIIKNLATLEDNTVLDQLKADKVFDSNILHATLSDMILDTTNNTILKVPYLSINEEAIRYTKDAINYISIDELNAVISALLVLDINDFADVESINLDLIINNSNSLLASSIIHATLSNQLFSLGTDKVIIPTVNDEGNWIRQHVGVTEQETVYINKTELDKLFDALVLIGMTNINSFDG
ncbi:MAG: hypothetical protein K0Q49_1402, partial [Haloplasmataceae bacterium]|nr:hypothetical protein [Haloplasmataceae bacterium]